MSKIIICTVLLMVLATISLSGQSVNDYRTKDGADGLWITTSLWERYDGSGWINAVSYPIFSNAETITITTGTALAISVAMTIDQVVIESGASVTVTGGTTIVNNGTGTDLTIYGLLKVTYIGVSLASGATAVVGNGGIYEHNRGLSTPIITATWDEGSTCLISLSTSMEYSCMSQDFFNLTLSYATGSDRSFGVYPPIDVRGTLLLESGWFALVTSSTNVTLSVNNLTVTGGRFTCTKAGGYPNLTIRNELAVQGGTFRITSAGNNARNYEVYANNVSLSNIGTIDLNSQLASSNMGRLYVSGDLSVSGGSLINTQSGTGRTSGIYFNGSDEQNFIWSGGFISTASTGVGRYFMYKTTNGPTKINEVYTADFAQTTVNGEDIGYLHMPDGFAQWPTGGPVINNVTINNTEGVTLSSDKKINGSMFLVDGVFDLSGYALTIADNAGITRNKGSFSSAPLFEAFVNLSYLFNPVATYTSHEVPTESGVVNNFVINNINGVYLNSGVSLIGGLVFHNGVLHLNNHKFSYTNREVAFSGDNTISQLSTDVANEPAMVGDGTQSISRKWKITGSITGEVDVTLSWHESLDNGGGFTGTASVWRCSEGRWYLLASDLSVQTVDGYRYLTFSTNLSSKGDENNEYTVTGEGQTLPVVLSSFTVNPNQYKYPLLTWTTQSETSLLGFYVYRGSSDQFVSSELVSGQIPATNTSLQHTYSFVDEYLMENGHYYFWLQIAGLEGSSVYFGPRDYYYSDESIDTPDFTLKSGIKSVYPNPFNPSVNINYYLSSGNEVSMKIFNQRGQLVYCQSMGFLAAGSHHNVWNGTDKLGRYCSSGLYFIELYIGKEGYRNKLCLQK